jgi:glycerol-3-phosphate dehydrogenase (NAD(P)+)
MTAPPTPPPGAKPDLTPGVTAEQQGGAAALRPFASVGIVGDGQMALALADLLAFRGAAVTVWSPFAEAAEALRRTRTSTRLPGFWLPAEIAVTADPAGLGGVDLLVNGIPTQYIRPTWQRLAAQLRPGTPIVSVAKGIEIASLRRPSELLSEASGGGGSIAVLSGPTVATELARRLPAVMVAASADPELAQRVQRAFASPWTRIYHHDDVLGVELAGALKNVIAVAAGLIDGLGLGVNCKSALLSRGLAEMARCGAALGARRETFFGVAGVGDLATTCFAPEGRNRSFGEALAKGSDAQRLLEAGSSVVEGPPTAKAAVAIAARERIEMPITAAVHDIVYRGRPPLEAVAELMARSVGAERIG